MHRVIGAFLPAMIAGGGGSIVNIASSVAATKAAPNRYVYAATKGAVVALTKAVAIDFITKGIRCWTDRGALAARRRWARRVRESVTRR